MDNLNFQAIHQLRDLSWQRSISLVSCLSISHSTQKDSCFEGAFPELYSCDSLLPRSKGNSLGALDHRYIFICWPAATRQPTWVVIIFLILHDTAYSSLGHHCCLRQRGVYGAQSWQAVRPVCTCCDSSFKLIVTQKFICHLLFLELQGTNFSSHLETGHVLHNHHWNPSYVLGGQ